MKRRTDCFATSIWQLKASLFKIRFLLSVLVLSQSWPFKPRRGVMALVTAKARTFPLAGSVRVCYLTSFIMYKFDVQLPFSR